MLNLNKQKLFLIAITYTIFVYVICLVKIEKPKSISVPNLDKLVHLGIYFVFTIVWFAYFKGLKFMTPMLKGVLKAVLLAFVVGVSIEFLQQGFTKARSGDIKDVFANCLGILLAVVFLYRIKKYKELKTVK